MSYLESLRSDLETIETFEQVICRKLEGREDIVEVDGKKKKRRKTHSSTLRDDHQLSAALSAVVTEANKWTSSFDESRLSEELREMRDTDKGGVGLFYQLRRNLVEYHQKNKDTANTTDIFTVPVTMVEEKMEQQVSKRMVFSGEECMGRYLDVHSFYTRYINLFAKDDKRAELGYLEYLDRLGLFMAFEISSIKSKAVYSEYVTALMDYLKGFSERAQPLVEVNLERAKGLFETQWEDGVVPGWKRKLKDNASVQKLSADELVKTLGGDGLKNELLVRGLKCGGRPIDRAQRLLKCTASDKVPSKQKLQKDLNTKELAQKEMLVQYLVEHLGEFIDATKDRVTKKQTQTYEELEAELAAEEELGEIDLDDLSDEENEDHVLHNPLNLPLGWDGKPIPFWLYKLHGLGVEFKCEICGNYSYWGRRSFDKHFQEWRHAHGMRMLKIPNTKHFHDITKIADALALYAKLRGKIESTVVAQEEFETSTGVKIDRKTYEDLKRQGLE